MLVVSFSGGFQMKLTSEAWSSFPKIRRIRSADKMWFVGYGLCSLVQGLLLVCTLGRFDIRLTAWWCFEAAESEG